MLPKILLIDDERSDVETLLRYFQQSGAEYDYRDTLEEGVEALLEGDYAAVVCDNHFYDESLSEYDPNFSGTNLIGILAGNVDFEERPELGEFAREYFGERLPDLQRSYEGKLIMFSGSAGSEDPHFLVGVRVIQKYPDRNGVCCEYGVIEALDEIGVLPSGDISIIPDLKNDPIRELYFN